MRITLKDIKALGLEYEVQGGDPDAREKQGRPEGEFQDKVMDYAALRGWLRAHFRPAKTDRGWRTPVSGDGNGFPDLILARERLVVVECKSLTGRLTDDQKRWIEAFLRCGTETYVWRPDDWDEVVKTLE